MLWFRNARILITHGNLDEGVYNTYIIDSDYDNWALLMHCAEKKKSSRYISALMMSRTTTLGYNVKAFLREKLPKYNIDVDFMFEVRHDDCKNGITSMKDYYEYVLKNKEYVEDEDVKIVTLTTSRFDHWLSIDHQNYSKYCLVIPKAVNDIL